MFLMLHTCNLFHISAHVASLIEPGKEELAVQSKGKACSGAAPTAHFSSCEVRLKSRDTSSIANLPGLSLVSSVLRRSIQTKQCQLISLFIYCA